MDAFRITGGRPLSGTVAAGGAKNAALPIMAAALLADGPVSLSRVPNVRDVRTLAQLLSRLGMHVERTAAGQMLLETIDPTQVRADARLVARMRASFCVLGPLLARRRRAVVPLPGGCAIGERPVDLHLRGLAALGADIQVRTDCVVARATRLTGARIDLLGPNGSTVTGTANVMTAATLARGTTVITSAATEPEIVDLGLFLNRLGARVTGLSTSTIEIRGVDQLAACQHRVIPDRIEAATLLVAAAITGGRVTVRDVVPAHLGAVLTTLAEMGVGIVQGDDWITATAGDRLRATDIDALPYPHVPTDVQSQFTALATLATGRSRVRDHVFPERFHHVRQLRRLGARIEQTPDGALIHGAASLAGATVVATDLRASAALVLAGLAATGVTTIRRINHLDRGYERLDEKLNRLGADIERVSERRPLQQGRFLAAPLVEARS